MKRTRNILMIASLWLLQSCTHGNQDVLNSAGIQAYRIERLWWLLFWVTLVVFVLVIAFLGGTLRGPQDPDALKRKPGPQDPERDRGLVIGVSVAAGLTILTLFVLLIAAISTGRAMASLQSKTRVTIEITGHQWWWEVRYPNSAPGKIVTTANEIHVPVGVPVVLNSTSTDVIHSFWAPNIQGKRDLIPGRTTTIWFQADREGVFRGQCAEFCGHQHAHMAFLLIAESPEKFELWLEHQREPAPEPVDAEISRGREVFMSGTCAMCHSIQGTNAGARNGPDLTHVASRSTLAAATIPNNIGYLAGWIADSQHIKPGNHMPPNPLPADDFQALLAYMETLR